MTNESLCCDQEHALLLQETGLMKDVEADGYYSRYINEDTWGYYADNKWYSDSRDYPDTYTYRLDKILAMLPEWFWDKGLYYPGYLKRFRLSDEKCDELATIVRNERFKLDDIYFRGQAACNAAAKLLHFLWKEKLI